MTDYVQRFNLLKGASQKKYMVTARGVTFVWGMLCCGFAFVVGDISDTVVESVNKIGSIFYGPVLAVFLLAFTTRFVAGIPAILGLFVGVGLNIYLWLYVPSVSWLWWNVFGLVAALVVAAGLSIPRLGRVASGPPLEIAAEAEEEDTRRIDLRRYSVLIAATVVIIVVSWYLGGLVVAK